MYNCYGIQLSNWNPSASLPQALGTIWSYAELDSNIKNNFDLKKVFWQNETVETVISEIDDPDVLVCSCYVWNWPKTYEIIKQIKLKYPNCLVVIGGPEPHYSVDWMQKHKTVDVLIPYYGEAVFRNVLLEFMNEQSYDTIDGVITKNVYNKTLPTIDYDLMPSPYLNGFFNNRLKELRKSTKSVRCVFESNRGCPYSCTFCDIGAKAYQKVKKFNLDRCKLELEWIVKNNIKVIDVADANFGIFDRDEEIVDTLIELKLKYSWKGRFLPTWSKARGDRVLRIAKKVVKNNLDTIFGLSLQSLNQSTLDAVKRINAFDLDELSSIIEDMNADGVDVYTELIFPMPGDTLDNFKEGMYNLLDMPKTFNKFQINHLSQLSNTEFNNELYNKLHQLEWASIKGFTRHYYGTGAKDIIAISNRSITKEETFEGLFFSKCLVIPLYFYGIIREFSNKLHKENIKSRSQLIKEIETRLNTVDWFVEFKKKQKQHYFDAINNTIEFGQPILVDKKNFMPEFAVAHQTYLENNIFDLLKEWYPTYTDIIDYDRLSIWTGKAETLIYKETVFQDTREKSHDEYCNEIYVIGRFDDRWRKEIIRKEQC